MSQLGDTLKGIVEISKGEVCVLNAKQTQGSLCTQLLETATQHEQIELRGTARWLLKMLAASFGIHVYSFDVLREFQKQRSEFAQSTLPKIQIQKINNETACSVFRSAKRQDIVAFIIANGSDDAPSLASFSAILLSNAIQTDYKGILFLKELGKIGASIQGGDANKAFIVEEQHLLPEIFETDLDQHFKKYKTTDMIHQLLKTTKIKLSLKDEIAFAGTESKQKQHHALYKT